jgi:hypothetical protein
MHFLMLFLLGTFVSAPADASINCAEDELPREVQENFSSVDDLLNKLEGQESHGVNFEGCSTEAMAYLPRSAEIAKEMSARLIADVKAAQPQTDLEQRNLALAVSKLECVQRKLNSATVHCKNLGGDLGRAIPFIGTGIAIDPDAIAENHKQYHWTNITLDYNAASTMLHEMTHKCGTGDKDYFPGWNDSLLTGGSKWANVADTYQNWALWGFCLPGPQCASRQPVKKK